MRALVLLLAMVLFAPGVLAQSPLVLNSRVESGWTSNALESPGGSPDFYLRHSHDLAVGGVVGPLALRGGLLLEQQVFRTYRGENDLTLTGGVEAGLRLGEGLSLRLGYALTQDWRGEMLNLGPVLLTISNPAREHEMLGELIAAGAGRVVTLGVDIRHRQPGPASFEGLPLPPEVIDPEIRQVTGRVDAEWAIGPGLAGLARLHWITTAVPEADRETFGREPARMARLAAGLRLRQDHWYAEAQGGFDLAWPQAAPHLRQVRPYLDAKADLAVTERLRLAARALAAMDLFEPLDGVASHRLELDLSARLALSDRVALSLGLGASREQGLYDALLVSRKTSVNGGLALAIAPGLDAELRASHAMVEEPGAAYPVTTLGLILGGRT